MNTGVHKQLGTVELLHDDTSPDISLDGSERVIETVLGLCDESNTDALRVDATQKIDLPTFAEQKFAVHKIEPAVHQARPDLAPGTRQQREAQLRESGDWTALAELLIERVEETVSASDAATLLVEIASLYREQLRDPAAAEVILIKALQTDPSHLRCADALEQLARETGDWTEYQVAFRLAAEALTDSEPSTSGEFWIRLASAQEPMQGFPHLVNVRAAIPSRVKPYLDVLEAAIRKPRELDTMLAVSHRIGDQDRSARLLSRAIAMSQSVLERANFHHLIAEIELDREEVDAAEWHWSEALRLDPRRHDAREELSKLYKERGEFRKAAALLDDARSCSADAARRAEYALRAADIYAQELGENTRAVDLYAAALEVRPGALQASLPVVERYYEQGRWQELQPVLESLLKGHELDGFDPTQQGALYLKAGECALQLEQHELALGYFGECVRRTPRELQAVLGSARSNLALQNYRNVISDIDRALILHDEYGHVPAQMAETLILSAEAHLKGGKQERAISLYTLCAEKGHLGAMAALADIHSLRGEHHEAVSLRLKRAQGLEKEDRVTLLCEVAETLGNEIRDVEAAIDICWQALSVDRQCRAALHLLAVFYTKSEQWRDAIKTILRMAELETCGMRRARYLQAAGTIARQENQIVEAVALLNKAIDSYSADSVKSMQTEVRTTIFACFESILEILTRQGDWRAVEQNYRRMICRLEPGDPEVGGLWSSLGHVYREKLEEKEAAIDSFEVACSLDQSRLTNHRILIDLYEGAGTDQLDKAIARRRLLLAAEPGQPEHYKALRSLFVRTRQMDRVWCVCRALHAMGAADDREVAFYRRNLNPNMVWPARPMNGEMWSRIRDSRVDPGVSRIFGLVSEVLAQQQAVSPAQAGIRETHDHQFEHLRQFFSATSYALGLPSFDCFVQPGRGEAVTLYNIRRGIALEPTFVLGRSLYEGRPIPHIVNGLARYLFYGRRSYYLRLAFPDPADLAAAFYAGVSLMQPDFPLPPNLGRRVHTYREALRKQLHPTWARKLHAAVHEFLRAGESFDLAQWTCGVDATARHAALLLCGDLDTAIASVDLEPLGLTTSNARQAKRQLLLESISEAHLSLREDLGLAQVHED